MLNIIPYPNGYKKANGKIVLKRNYITICFRHKEIKDRILPMISRELKSDFTEVDDKADIVFNYSNMKNGTYSLYVKEDHIEVVSGDYEGAFYALTTLRQLLMTDLPSDEFVSECLTIEDDGGNKAIRGLQLDESRHFFGIKTVKKLLDFMSLYKFNRFHWHLTDNQGWRIEIKKYPLLTEIGSKRIGTQLHHWQCTQMDEKPHGGYYTQEEIKEIIKYASDRCIEIIPEIDFPAHCASAIAAYSNLACRNIPSVVPPYFCDTIPNALGIKDWNRPLCLGKDEALDFVFGVLGEVCDLFPGEIIHVGGDEAPRQEWEKCPLCQKRIKDEGLKDEKQLQGWFTNKINAFLKSKNKKMMCWNEVLSGGIADKDIIIQYWTPKPDIKVSSHLHSGGKVVLSCHKYMYFDMLHSYCTTKGTYSFKPSKAYLFGNYGDNILGYEGEVWTEFIENEDHLFFMLFNRALALSEAAWTNKKNKSFFDFSKRLEHHKKIMDELKINYGQDFLTMEKSSKEKRRLLKENNIDPKHFDSEYRVSEMLKGKG